MGVRGPKWLVVSATDGRSAAEEWLVISGHGGESTGTLLGPGAVDVLQDAVAAPAVGERVGVTVRWHTSVRVKRASAPAHSARPTIFDRYGRCVSVSAGLILRFAHRQWSVPRARM